MDAEAALLQSSNLTQHPPLCTLANSRHLVLPSYLLHLETTAVDVFSMLVARLNRSQAGLPPLDECPYVKIDDVSVIQLKSQCIKHVVTIYLTSMQPSPKQALQG